MSESNIHDKDIFERTIRDLGLGVMARHALLRGGIGTIGDLVQQLEVNLLALKGFGTCCLRQVKERLAYYGLTLAMSAKAGPLSETVRDRCGILVAASVFAAIVPDILNGKVRYLDAICMSAVASQDLEAWRSGESLGGEPWWHDHPWHEYKSRTGG